MVEAYLGEGLSNLGGIRYGNQAKLTRNVAYKSEFFAAARTLADLAALIEK